MDLACLRHSCQASIVLDHTGSKDVYNCSRYEAGESNHFTAKKALGDSDDNILMPAGGSNGSMSSDYSHSFRSSTGSGPR